MGKDLNLYFAKGFVDIYNFNRKQAGKNINLSSKFNNNNELYSNIKTIKIISNVINFDLDF
tara:strand:- start:393 stop:575 length:183 start_codon:yes stop_codon:yes gene_type:complete